MTRRKNMNPDSTLEIRPVPSLYDALITLIVKIVNITTLL